MNSRPLVSIISSIYNVESFLPKMLDSVINQSYKNLQIILVNNGCTDSSSKILIDFKKRDSRIELIELKENKGASGGINEAIKHIKGEFFTQVDSDDWLELDCIEKVIELIDDETDFVQWKYVECYEDLKIEPNNLFNTGVFNPPLKKELLIAHLLDRDGEYDNRIINEVGTPWAKMYKTSKIKEVYHIPKLTMFEDYLFNIKAIQRCENFYLINKSFYNLRRGTTSYSSSKAISLQKIQECLKSYKLIKNELNNYFEYDNVRKAFDIFSIRIFSTFFQAIFSYKSKEVYYFFSKNEILSIKKNYRKILKKQKKGLKTFLKTIFFYLPNCFIKIAYNFKKLIKRKKSTQ